ncbi:hypothetical protein VNI00_015842 [Paramarasmius palmivorus]|uniref:Uncharacterized protein n=1 Tax=Paramarasmius palmivorus TaxID=297713 RepID=A0AAW0BJB5_9AGAR
MRRTVEYLEWRATEWETAAEIDLGFNESTWEGYQAYALSQAVQQRELRAAFEAEWNKPLEAVQHAEELEEDLGEVEEEGEEDEDDVEDQVGSPGVSEADDDDGDEGLGMAIDGDETAGEEEWDPERDGF